jgi:tetratricopeptide (TPR) repeat protein
MSGTPDARAGKTLDQAPASQLLEKALEAVMRTRDADGYSYEARILADRIMGLACFYQGMFSEAAILLEEAASAKPAPRDAQLHLPAALVETGAYAQARARLEAIRADGLSHPLLDAAAALIELSRPGGRVDRSTTIRNLRSSSNPWVLSVAERMEADLRAHSEPAEAQPAPELVFDVAPVPGDEPTLAPPLNTELSSRTQVRTVTSPNPEREITFETASPTEPSSELIFDVVAASELELGSAPPSEERSAQAGGPGGAERPGPPPEIIFSTATKPPPKPGKRP